MQNPTLAAALALAISCAAPTMRAENWPQWRGPAFNGSTPETHLPGEGLSTNQILWAAPMPGGAAATPVIWGDRVFLTSGNKETGEVLAMCFDARKGKSLWQFPLGQNHRTDMDNDMAAPSPVTDGERAWFLDGTGQLLAVSKDGKKLWQRDLAKDYNAFAIHFGYSSSPLLFDGKLYILFLQNEKPLRGSSNSGAAIHLDSFFLALDPATGHELWKQVRDTDGKDQAKESYVTPYPMLWNGRREIVLSGGQCVTGHDPASGAELWRWSFPLTGRVNTDHVVPTPVAEDGLIYVMRPEQHPLFALHAGATGAVDDKAVAWSYAANKCWISSPLAYRSRLYLPQEEQGYLVCLNEKTGDVVWRNKLSVKGRMQCSPTGADGKIYMLSLNAELLVLAAGDEFHELASLKLDDSTLNRSTVAVANGELFVRTGANLYCFGAH